MKRDPCACGRPYHARGLCAKCYLRVWRDGQVPDYRPGRLKSGPLVAEDYEFIRPTAPCLTHAADRLSMTRAALYQALRRQGFRYNAQREGYYR